MAHEEIKRQMAEVDAEMTVQVGNLSAFRKNCIAARREEFLAAGGCDRCGGRGWIVTWDTMDSLSGCYAEYGTCPKCDGKGPKVLDRSYSSKYDRNRRVSVEFFNADEEQICEQLAADIQRLQAAYAELEDLLDPAVKGRKICVTRGNKRGGCKKGDVGVVFWVKEQEYYRYNRLYRTTVKIGAKREDGSVFWTTEGCSQVHEIGTFEIPGEDEYSQRKRAAANAKLTVEVTEVTRETAKAWRVTIGGSPEWLPKSQCDRTAPNTFEIPRWLADKKGL